MRGCSHTCVFTLHSHLCYNALGERGETVSDDIYYGLENDYVETFDDESVLEEVYAMVDELEYDALLELREHLREVLNV